MNSNTCVTSVNPYSGGEDGDLINTAMEVALDARSKGINYCCCCCCCSCSTLTAARAGMGRDLTTKLGVIGSGAM
jgi:hypothetical protein